jgi:hypothetical protein
MAAGARTDDHGGMEVLFGYVLLFILAVGGAVRAGIKATDPENTTGRKAALWRLSTLLTGVALLLAMIGYWFWRFSVEFTI